MGYFLDAAQMTVASAPGTGAITLGSAVSGFQTFAAAGASSGQIVSYAIQDAAGAFEYGRGTYSSTGPTLTRTTILGSSNSGSAINATAAAIVTATALAEDLNAYGVGFRNRLRNASAAINQRALSGTVTLTAGQYGHDGFKGGASGSTYTFATSGIDTTLTITAGSLILPIEAGMIEGGSYAVSNAGTAQARVWQGTGSTGSGSYAAAPFVTASLTAATQTNLEFSTGTVLRPQFEPGVAATPFERRPPGVELALCQRYLPAFNDDGSLITLLGSAFAATTTSITSIHPFAVPPRVTPTGVTISALSGFTIGAPIAQVPTAATFNTLSSPYAGVVSWTIPTAVTLGIAAMVRTTSASAQILFTGCEI